MNVEREIAAIVRLDQKAEEHAAAAEDERWEVSRRTYEVLQSGTTQTAFAQESGWSRRKVADFASVWRVSELTKCDVRPTWSEAMKQVRGGWGNEPTVPDIQRALAKPAIAEKVYADPVVREVAYEQVAYDDAPVPKRGPAYEPPARTARDEQLDDLSVELIAREAAAGADAFMQQTSGRLSQELREEYAHLARRVINKWQRAEDAVSAPSSAKRLRAV